jgi:hypothetical protein
MKKLVTENLDEYENLNESLMTKYLDLDKIDEDAVKDFALDLVCKTYNTGSIWKYSKSYNFFKYLINDMSIYKVLEYLRDAAGTNFNGKTAMKLIRIDSNRLKKSIYWQRK